MSPDNQCSLHHNWWPPGRRRLAWPCAQPGLLFGPRSGVRQVLDFLTRSGHPLPPPSPGSCTFPIPSPSRHICLSPRLTCHVIYLLIQPLPRGSGQYTRERITKEVKTLLSPPVERKQGALLFSSPGMKLQSSVRPCHGIHCGSWPLGKRNQACAPSPTAQYWGEPSSHGKILEFVWDRQI